MPQQDAIIAAAADAGAPAEVASRVGACGPSGGQGCSAAAPHLGVADVAVDHRQHLEAAPAERLVLGGAGQAALQRAHMAGIAAAALELRAARGGRQRLSAIVSEECCAARAGTAPSRDRPACSSAAAGWASAGLGRADRAPAPPAACTSGRCTPSRAAAAAEPAAGRGRDAASPGGLGRGDRGRSRADWGTSAVNASVRARRPELACARAASSPMGVRAVGVRGCTAGARAQEAVYSAARVLRLARAAPAPPAPHFSELRRPLSLPSSSSFSGPVVHPRPRSCSRQPRTSITRVPAIAARWPVKRRGQPLPYPVLLSLSLGR
jgi:hypothetical protein